MLARAQRRVVQLSYPRPQQPTGPPFQDCFDPDVADYECCRASHAFLPRPMPLRRRESMRGVMNLHRDAVEEIQPSDDFGYLKDAARDCWEAALAKGEDSLLQNIFS